MGFSVMRYISSGAVLQCDEKNTIFGSADRFSEVKLGIFSDGQEIMTLSAVADENSKWSITLPPFKGGFKSYTFIFSCQDETYTADDLLFGEVYHISGQSNMELQINRTYHPLKPFLHEESNYIREFRVPLECFFDGSEKKDDFRGGTWLTAKGDMLMEMSAVGYWFAIELFGRLAVPVGLLNTSAGGSAVESRMPGSMLSSIGGYEELLEACSKGGYMEKTARSDAEREALWYEKLSAADDISDKVFGDDFAFEGKCSIPFYFRETKELDGFCGRIWFKKTFNIPESVKLCDAELILGAIIDRDIAYMNGVQVGVTDYMYPPRIYNVEAGLLRHGQNTVHICVEVKNGKGGFVRGKEYCLKIGSCVIDISGSWEYSAVKAELLEPALFFPSQPLGLYSTMTSPAFNINVRGMLWYQGETNADKADRYPDLFRRFAEMYRTECGKDIPIIFAQLPNFDDPVQDVPVDSWAEFRLAQEKCLEVPGTAMAVTIGCGESNDLHPIDKKTVGERLAWCTLDLVYDIKTYEYSCCKSAEYRDGMVYLSFSGPEIELRNDPPRYLEAVYGSSIVKLGAKKTAPDTLSMPSGSAPDFVRYAYTNDPAEPDLFNSDGLPVPPFIKAVKH